MALETTPGASDADAFLSLAEADDYHSTRQLHTQAGWDTLTDGQQEAAIRMATSIITDMPFLGYAATTTQALAWPREEVIYNNTVIDHTIVPDKVKWATAELAAWLASENRDSVSPGQTIDYVKVGSVETSFRFSAGGIAATMPSMVVNHLKGLLHGSARGGGIRRVAV